MGGQVGDGVGEIDGADDAFGCGAFEPGCCLSQSGDFHVAGQWGVGEFDGDRLEYVACEGLIAGELEGTLK